MIETLSACDISVSVFKLHHNRVDFASDLAWLVSCGTVRELHLSHNRLDTAGAAELILAAAGARDERGAWRYPWSDGGPTAPLWLRLEQNNQVDGEDLTERLNAGIRQLQRPGRLFCRVDGRMGCTPRACLVCQEAPALHVTYLASQNLQQAGGDDKEWDASASSWSHSGRRRQQRWAEPWWEKPPAADAKWERSAGHWEQDHVMQPETDQAAAVSTKATRQKNSRPQWHERKA